ncbi:MAG: rRNA maturation RNase YbeY [Oscillospiraceae bacterium]|nr:rRNA maturation RNase YbeY [Oscillospiraceae bacterium]MDD3832382.1 rRNA maturation RNase YbeY [Oscillospiraceae bacterium]MDD4546787.1 rRNA maturation RNase YbeY [Oscillospiraceae bacterium]
MEKIKVIIENKQKTIRIPTGIRLLIRRCCHATLALENFQGSAEIGVSIVDDDQIRQINNEYRHIDSSTDVLSFPMGENGEFDKNPENGAYILGDVILSIERAKDQSTQFDHSLQREVGYLVVHSVLHILGYDHVDGGLESVRMREKEEEIMASVGLPRGPVYVLSGNER